MNLKELSLVKSGIIVKPHEGEETTSSGFILSGANDTNNLQKGYVEVINDSDAPDGLSDAEYVLYSKYAGMDIRLEGTDYRLIKSSDIVFAKF